MHRLTPKFALRLSAISACAAAIVGLTGCAGISGTALSGANGNSVTVTVPKISVHGGQQPIAYAHVYLYAANDQATAPVFGGATCPTPTPGYGAAACSILGPATQTTLDGNGNYYLTTDVNGSFSYGSLALTCPSAESQIYILATGGNATGYAPSPTTNQNAAIALSAAIGSCDATHFNSTTFTSVNEVTTAAMAFGLGKFMTSPTNVGAPVANAAGLKNAFLNVSNLVDNTTGTARTTVPGTIGTTGTVSTASLNLVANILATCVNSGGPSSTPCTTLFNDTNLPTSSDTLSAAVSIAANPSLNASDLATLVPATAPFQPTIDVHTQVVTDLAVSVSYKRPTAFAGQGNNLVVDKDSNIWVVNCQSCLPATAGAGQPTLPASPVDSIVEYSPTGSLIATVTGPGIHNTQGMAIDSTGSFLYTANQVAVGSAAPDQITRINIGTGIADAPFANAALASPSGLAFDNNGALWVTNPGNGSVLQLAVGATITLTNTYNGGSANLSGLTLPLGVGTDNNGIVWVMATNSNINTGHALSPPALAKFLPGTGAVNYYTTVTIPNLLQPLDVSIDTLGNIWTFEGQSTNNAVTKIDSNGNELFTKGAIGINQAAITAIDGDSTLFVPSCGTYPRCSSTSTALSGQDNLVRVSSDGNTIGQVKSPAFNGIVGIGVDAAGNAWTSSYVDGSVTEVFGYGAPTTNPLATASSTAFLGKRPQ